jgi:hypothetical protein
MLFCVPGSVSEGYRCIAFFFNRKPGNGLVCVRLSRKMDHCKTEKIDEALEIALPLAQQKKMKEKIGVARQLAITKMLS